jgi:hypothetical protein
VARGAHGVRQEPGARHVDGGQHGQAVVALQPLAPEQLVGDAHQGGIGEQSAAAAHQLLQGGALDFQLQYSFHRRSTFSTMSGRISTGLG